MGQLIDSRLVLLPRDLINAMVLIIPRLLAKLSNRPPTAWFAVQFNCPIKQLDVSNVFLHGVLDDAMYME